MEVRRGKPLNRDMQLLVSALATLVPGSSAKEIVFIPEGENMIYPLSHPDGVKVVLPADRGPAIAAAFNGKLQAMLGRNVKPWFDFEHTRKAPRSGAPKAFRYEAGKGIMCSVEWSGSGKTAIDNKDVEHFSPEFYVDAASVPCDIPDRGPLGGLVAEPAFREIPAVAASDAAPQSESKKQNTMSLLILASIGLLTQNEAARDDAESIARSRVTALRGDSDKLTAANTEITTLKGEKVDLQQKVTAAENATAALRKTTGENLFQRAVKAGLAAPKDDDKKQEYIQAAESGNALALKLLTERVEAAEGGTTTTVEGTIIQAGAANRPAGGGGEHAFIVESRKLVTAGQAKTEVEAYGILSETRPELYDDYTKQFQG